ncbi:MAG: ribonuclease [Candidatus Devosia phytovorans]|uniref:Ribonuclease n=1 Tax=Candidatus Devosia phytovorans TaxID=3121372 RepID=A0AAJ5VUQ9_9HYPH|nr:ribonuclease [Devosia sp.]WEK05231.1 MAG: ribonuclease [Devosia sp.]
MRFMSAFALLGLLTAPTLAQERTQYVLAISWQPAFCETRPDRAECESQTVDRFDAGNFALHGLWPQPRSRDYCGVDAETVALDEQGDWDLLPEPDISDALRDELQILMPGTHSGLDRHEWITHGTCYDGDAEAYFGDSLDLLDAVNETVVRDLFASNIGKRLTQGQVRAAFDEAFGPGAGDRVRLSCVNDGNRRLIDELTIGLTGQPQGPDSFGRLILAARPTDGGCDGGMVDAVGLQ